MSVIIKFFIILILVVILFSMGAGLIFLIKDKGKTQRTVRALTVRIALSVSLFALLIIGYLTGIIQPHGIYG